MRNTAATDELNAGFRQGFDSMGRDSGQDRAIVLTSWPSVPVEIIRAAGFESVTALGGPRGTPAADAMLESDIFPSRLRHLVEKALTGKLDGVAAIVLPRTSDSDYKCFLYLREFVRRGVIGSLPPVLLFDLLQSANARVADYDAERVSDLFDKLLALSGRRASPEGLQQEIASANDGRAAARRLLGLRVGEPRIKGSEALPLLGAFWQVPAKRYAPLAEAATVEIAGWPSLENPRVLLAGAPVDSVNVHAAVEAAGGVVVAEVSPFGSGVAGDDVVVNGNPVTALADKYRRDSIDARTPVKKLRQWFEDSVESADAVLLSQPPYDGVFGWDYPALCELLNRRSIPHAVIEGDPGSEPTDADHDRIVTLIGEAAEKKAARYG